MNAPASSSLFSTAVHRVVIRAAWFLAMLAAGLATVRPGVGADTPTAALGTRHSETNGGFSICPPAGWTLKEYPHMKFQAIVGPTARDFAPNVNIVDESSSGTLRAYVSANVELLGRAFQSFKNLGQTEFKTASGWRGFRLTTESDQGGRRLRQIFYFFDGKDGKKLVFTCSAIAADGIVNDAMFDACLTSLVREK